VLEGREVRLGEVRVRYVHSQPSASYSLIEWSSPPGVSSPPLHLHRQTDEGFYVLEGRYAFLVEGTTSEVGSGGHVLVTRGQAHTFWNAGDVDARCLVVMAPSGFEAYFAELAEGLGEAPDETSAMEVRRRLSAKHDIEVLGPPVGRDGRDVGGVPEAG
jgi:mannose-6-phosphate isomerase-like protein (cupin superfamily)